MVVTALSRAAAEDKPAPAYLFSGTRGVGKTTVARILAKALNCAQAPCADPCNQCDQCRAIIRGNHVDVTEIDGASNNSVEDARALRENIGYAPMEGRYKIFIIDEAHMLSRSAFNALLKTLEEPPPRVVFIFATTEAHKFPITIVSRCQHFIFRRLPEAALEAHLSDVLRRENARFDPQAVRLTARRAAGSVRDGMSLLGQILALSGEGLTMEATRSVLGLAGRDLFLNLLEALAAQDCAAVVALSRELLDQGVDIGFFLREFAGLWRALFLLRHAGQAVLPALDLPEDEASLWLDMAPRFSATHLHAAWHMTLESQRKIVFSPEPAAALELLLLNLALMPRLLPLDRLPGMTEPVSVAEASPPEPDRLQPPPPPRLRTEKEPPPSPEQSEKTVPAGESEERRRTPQPAREEALSHSPPAEPRWEEFLAHCAAHGQGEVSPQLLRQTKGRFEGAALIIATETGTVYERLEKTLDALRRMAMSHLGRPVEVRIEPPARPHKSETALREEFAAKEELQPCLEILDAAIARVRPLNK